MPFRSSIFRSQALEHYVHSREKSILPRLATPPVFLFLWALVSLATVAFLVAWFGQVPLYTGGTGLVVDQNGVQNRQPVHQSIALIFIPVDPPHPWHIHPGALVRLEIGTQARPFTAVVDGVEPGILSPDEIQQRYAPGSRISSLVTGPSIVISIKLGSAVSSQVYAGSLINAQIQIGSTSLFLYLFGSTQLGGA